MLLVCAQLGTANCQKINIFFIQEKNRKGIEKNSLQKIIDQN